MCGGWWDDESIYEFHGPLYIPYRRGLECDTHHARPLVWDTIAMLKRGRFESDLSRAVRDSKQTPKMGKKYMIAYRLPRDNKLLALFMCALERVFGSGQELSAAVLINELLSK